MRKTLRATFLIGAFVLCAFAPALSKVNSAADTRAQGQAGDAAGAYTARVKKDEARFTMPVPARDVWKWRVPGTRERGREYMMSVRVRNDGVEYSFGFFLWKFPGSAQGSGSFSSLLKAGQSSMFARNAMGQMIMVRDASVKIKEDDGRLVINVSGRSNVEKLFSGRPAEVTFQTEMPGEPPASHTVPVTYAN